VKRIYGTLVDGNGVRHYTSGVRCDEGLLVRRRGKWDANTFCGNYIDVAPGEPKDVVTCFRCLWKAFRPSNLSDALRGKTADLVIINEASEAQ
jgi:hypothetical protein